MILKYTELILADQNSSLSNLLLVPWEIPLSAQKSFSVSGAHRAGKVSLRFTMRTSHVYRIHERGELQWAAGGSAMAGWERVEV